MMGEFHTEPQVLAMLCGLRVVLLEDNSYTLRIMCVDVWLLWETKDGAEKSAPFFLLSCIDLERFVLALVA